MAAASLTPAEVARTSACVAALTAWREEEAAQQTPLARAFLHEASTLRRYAVARNGDVLAATAALRATLAWREEHMSPPLSCPACDSDPLSHCFFAIGHCQTEHSRPIIYSCPRRAKINDAHVTVRHMAHTLERAFAARGSGEQWLWLVDFRGFGMSDAMQARTSTQTITTFSAHFPERLGAVLLLSPPSLFDMLLAVVRPFLDARTLGKVAIVRPPADPTPEALAPLLAPWGLADPAQLEWLAAVLAMPPVPGSMPPVAPLGLAAAAMRLEPAV